MSIYFTLYHSVFVCCVCVCEIFGSVQFGLYIYGNYGEYLEFRHMNESTKMILVHMRCKVLNNLNLQQPMRSHISFQFYNIWQLMLVVLAGLAGSYYALMLRDMLMPQLDFVGI